jgi:beta-xylosidase
MMLLVIVVWNAMVGITRGRLLMVALLLICFNCSAQQSRDSEVFSKGNGNPIIPAYLADASLFYDEHTDAFYAYGTNDGNSGENVFPTQAWYSKDGKNWKNQIVTLPKEWTDAAGTNYIWAPSIVFHPDSKKYYLMYSIESKVFIAMSNHPLGPWKDANSIAPGKLFYKGYDGQFFLDDDKQLYITTDAREFRIIKLNINKDGKLSFNQTDNRFPLIEETPSSGKYRYSKISNLKNAFEASLIYKRNGIYYMMWSFEGSENYNVRYAVSKNVAGPYREIAGSMTEPILSRDDDKNILGPGHHSMMEYKGRTFIAYHRQSYPFIDSKRQTCIDEVFFNKDGSIKKIIPTHQGVILKRSSKLSRPKNLALGKPVVASSVRKYDAQPYDKRYRTHEISFEYKGEFAVDENNGTRWDAGLDAKDSWLIVDLGKDYRIDSIETTFEFTSRTYKYKLECLSANEAIDLNAAAIATSWSVFADKSLGQITKSPVVNTSDIAKPTLARFIKLTISGALNLPYTADGADLTNARNSLSVFELKVFGQKP